MKEKSFLHTSLHPKYEEISSLMQKRRDNEWHYFYVKDSFRPSYYSVIGSRNKPPAQYACHADIRNMFDSLSVISTFISGCEEMFVDEIESKYGWFVKFMLEKSIFSSHILNNDVRDALEYGLSVSTLTPKAIVLHIIQTYRLISEFPEQAYAFKKLLEEGSLDENFCLAIAHNLNVEGTYVSRSRVHNSNHTPFYGTESLEDLVDYSKGLVVDKEEHTWTSHGFIKRTAEKRGRPIIWDTIPKMFKQTKSLNQTFLGPFQQIFHKTYTAEQGGNFSEFVSILKKEVEKYEGKNC